VPVQSYTGLDVGSFSDTGALLGKSPTVQIEINGIPTGCIVDTGAETSLISSDYYWEVLSSKGNGLSPVGDFVRLVGANGLEIPVTGLFVCSIAIAGREIEACFLVKDSEGAKNTGRDNDFPVLLGCNILRSILQIPVEELEVIDGEWKLVASAFALQTSQAELGKPAVHDIAVKEWSLCSGPKFQVLGPMSAQQVACYVKGESGPERGQVVFVQGGDLTVKLDGTLAIVQTDQDGSQGSLVHTVSSIQLIDSDHVEIVVVNQSQGQVVIIPDTRLASAVEAYSVDSIYLEHTVDGLAAKVREVVVSQDAGHQTLRSNKTSTSADIELATDQLHEHSAETPGESESCETVELPPGLILPNLSPDQLDAIAQLLIKWDTAFSKDSLDVGHCDIIPHQIKLKDPNPVNVPFRRIAPHIVQDVKEQLEGLLRKGIIRKSASPYASAVVPVKKKDGTIRICIDYRQLNSKSVRDLFPLPRIQEVLECLGGASMFSSMDLAHGYFQVSMHPDSIPLTAFRVPWGLYEFVRMPQGLANSPATFQRVMEQVFGEVNMTELVIYLDDVLVFSPDFDSHLDRLDRVFERLVSAGLKLNGRKCRLFQESVLYLGHIVSKEGIAVDPSKIIRVVEWPTPADAGQLSSFLGLASYYRKFIPNFAAIAAPLHAKSAIRNTTGKPEAKWVWDAKAEEAFQLLKSTLTVAPVMAFPDFSKEFVLEVDASLSGLGACLGQEDSAGRLHPIAYASRCLRGAERSYPDYSSFKLELLALKWAVTDKFREYLLGQRCIVWTDNNPLVYLTTAKLGATETRWASQLAMFNLEIRYRTGKTNRCADALSRFPSQNSDSNVQVAVEQALGWSVIPSEMHSLHQKAEAGVSEKSIPVRELDAGAMDMAGPGALPSCSREQFSNMQKQDEILGQIWKLWNEKWVPSQSDAFPPSVGSWLKAWHAIVEHGGVLYRKVDDSALGSIAQVLVPKKLQTTLIEAAHDKWGHQGANRTYSLLRSRAYWPGMQTSVKQHVKSCFHCTKSKLPTMKVRTPLRHLMAFQPMELVAVDFVKLDKGKHGFEDVLAITDAFTKWSQAVPCRDQKAATTAQALIHNWIALYGVPLRLHSDRGRNFEGELLRELCKMYGITKTRTTCYHPQGNAQTERFNKTLCNLIKSVEKCRRREWPDMIRSLVFMYNSTPHSVTGIAPYVLLFGRQPTVPLDHLIGNVYNNWDDNFVQEQAELLQRAWRVARRRMEGAHQANKARYDRKANATPLPIGAHVLRRKMAFQDRHKLEDSFDDVQYVVVSKNVEDDVYAIRPAHGGEKLRVNRKLLILDPRDSGETLVDISDILPEFKEPNPSDSDDSYSSDPEGDVLFRLVPVMDRDVSPGRGDDEIVPTANDDEPNIGLTPRRSKRTNKGQHSNPDRLPKPTAP
jgi:transposase InsO family protein